MEEFREKILSCLAEAGHTPQSLASKAFENFEKFTFKNTYNFETFLNESAAAFAIQVITTVFPCLGGYSIPEKRISARLERRVFVVRFFINKYVFEGNEHSLWMFDLHYSPNEIKNAFFKAFGDDLQSWKADVLKIIAGEGKYRKRNRWDEQCMGFRVPFDEAECKIRAAMLEEIEPGFFSAEFSKPGTLHVHGSYLVIRPSHKKVFSNENFLI